MLTCILLALGLGQLSLAKTVHYQWNITWVRAAPDGFERAVIGINGQWPCPPIDVNLGDTLVVDVYNGLGNQSTSLHWHGIHQNGTGHMDGASSITQCPIPPGSSFTYKFAVHQTGTYWYHSHNMGQYPDGLWGPLIVHDPNPPFHYDEEFTLTLSDWYHEEMSDMINTYQSPTGEAADGAPTPSGGALINSSKNFTIKVKPNKTYLIHVICPGNFPGHAWLFDQHPMTTVEIDGVYVDPVDVNTGKQQARIAPGQRQSVLITTKNDTSQNYPIWDTMDVNMLFFNKGTFPPAGFNNNATGWLVYNESAPLPPAPILHSLGNSDFFDDINYVPLDREPVLEPVTHQLILNTAATNISDISRFTINSTTYLTPLVPSLYSALTLPKNYTSNPLVYGHVNPFIIPHNAIVEIVINNNNGNLHPWHLHGHQFQVLERTNPNTGSWPGVYSNHSKYPAKRDTVMLQDNAWAVIRFRADNPEFHTVSGNMGTIIEAPELLTSNLLRTTVSGSGFTNLAIPHDHLSACAAYPMPSSGNAAGNTKNPLNLGSYGTGQGVPSMDHGAKYPPGS